jgi:hypothetical protein
MLGSEQDAVPGNIDRLDKRSWPRTAARRSSNLEV